jgi:hypothetical protein
VSKCIDDSSTSYIYIDHNEGDGASVFCVSLCCSELLSVLGTALLVIVLVLDM